jgi:hypothetical protein
MRVPIESPNQSGRGGSGVTHIVLHTAQGALTYQSLGNYFASPAAQVSSHVGIADDTNTIGEYVARTAKAWTAADANPWSVQAELCAFAEWDAAEWDRHPNMIENTARWVAEEAAIYGIPLRALAPHEAQNPDARGVCQHADLGALGGGHWDCGHSFPMGRILELASGGGTPPTPTPIPPPTPKDLPVVFIAAPDNEAGQYLVDTSSGLLVGLTSNADAVNLIAADVQVVGLTGATWDNLRHALDHVS